MGDDALKLIKNLWHGKTGRVLAEEAIENIPNEIHKAKLFPGSTANKITESADAALKGIRSELYKLRSDAKTAAEELRKSVNDLVSLRREVGKYTKNAEKYSAMAEGHQRYIQYLQELPDPSPTDEKNLANAIRQYDLSIARANRERSMAESTKDSVQRIEQLVESNTLRNAEKEKQLKGLSDLHSEFISDPQSVFKNIINDPEALARYPSLSQVVSDYGRNIDIKNRAMKATSRYINNDRKFFKEYLNEIYPRLKGKPDDPYVQAWMLNPDNARKLAELRTSRRFRTLLGELETDPETLKMMEEVTRKLRRQTLTRVALGAGALGAGAIAFLKMFDETSEEVKQQVDITKPKTAGFKVYGAGKPVLDKAMQAAIDARQTIVKAEEQMKNDPAAASAQAMEQLDKHKKDLDESLKQWDLVRSNTDNPQAADEVYTNLSKLSNTLGSMLGETQKLVGEPKPGGVAGDIAQSRTQPDQIKALQQHLGVPLTGEIDQATVRALRQKELELDQIGNTGGRISKNRLLVRPEIGHIITLPELRKLETMIRQ